MSEKILVGRDLPLNVTQRTIGEFIFEIADIRGSNICQTDFETGKRETFDSVKKRSIRVALELQKRGVTANDVIALCSYHSLDNSIPLIATAFLSATFSTLDPALPVRDVRHLLNLIKPKFIFVDDDSVELIENAIHNEKIQVEIVVIGESTKYATLDEFLQPSEDEESFKPIIVDSNQTAAILFSSGTTGLPKAVRLSHSNLFYRFNEQVHYDRNIPNLSVLSFTSLYWISGLLTLLTSFGASFNRILMKRFDPEKTFQAIERYKPLFLMVIPAAAYQLANSDCASKFDLSHLKIAIIAGGAISATGKKKLETVFNNAVIICPYATTECGAIAVWDLTPDDLKLIQEKMVSCGKVRVRAQVKIVDLATEEILGANQKGEIRCKSPETMLGYINIDPKEVFDDDGFYKTGDIGYYDNDGCFFVVDRIKEIFKYKGFIIKPTVIEMVLLEHPSIIQACVFGVPVKECLENGEYPTACVVLKPNYTANVDEIIDFVSKRVADFEQLRGGVKIVDNIPVTPTGKIRRRLIREQFINSLNTI